MSTFICEHCKLICHDSPRGYTTGCEHYPPDIKPLRGFGFHVNIETGAQRPWYIDQYGQKRWGSNDEIAREALDE